MELIILGKIILVIVVEILLLMGLVELSKLF